MADAAPAQGPRRWTESPALQPLWRRMALAALSGAMAGLGHVPVSLVPLGLLGFALACVWLGTAASHRQAFLTGWAAGSGYFSVTLFWIVEPFLVDVARHGWMAPFALVFLAGGLALFWGAAFTLARAMAPEAGPRQSLAFVVALAAAELARSYVLTGFPWALPAYLWTEVPQRGWAALVGPHGLTVLTLALAALVSLCLTGRGRAALTRRAGAALAGLAVFLAGGAMLLSPPETPAADRPVVRLVQPNAAQDEKWDPEKAVEFVRRQIEYSAAPTARRPDLIVWPETAIPWLLDDAGPVLEEIAAYADGVPVILGAQRRDGGLAYNSLAVIGQGGAVGQIYDKHHLVPFGEYIPLGQLARLIGLRSFAARDGYGYSSGPGPAMLDLGPLGSALPLICYEAIFPQDVLAAPARPDLLLQITNDAWFGELAGPYQHLAQARMRAVEQNLPMIRVANTGVSAMIDPGGRVLDRIPLGEAGFRDVALPSAGAPTVYSRLGDTPVLVLLIALAAGLLGLRQRNSD